MPESKCFVRVDEHGVYRVGDAGVMFDSVLAGFFRAESPEYILQQYPSLSLEEVYGGIAYYLGHREEVEAYLKRRKEIWDAFRRECDENPSPVIERLRALRKTNASAQSRPRLHSWPTTT